MAAGASHIQSATPDYNTFFEEGIRSANHPPTLNVFLRFSIAAQCRSTFDPNSKPFISSFLEHINAAKQQLQDAVRDSHGLPSDCAKIAATCLDTHMNHPFFQETAISVIKNHSIPEKQLALLLTIPALPWDTFPTTPSSATPAETTTVTESDSIISRFVSTRRSQCLRSKHSVITSADIYIETSAKNIAALSGANSLPKANPLQKTIQEALIQIFAIFEASRQGFPTFLSAMYSANPEILNLSRKKISYFHLDEAFLTIPSSLGILKRDKIISCAMQDPGHEPSAKKAYVAAIQALSIGAEMMTMQRYEILMQDARNKIAHVLQNKPAATVMLAEESAHLRAFVHSYRDSFLQRKIFPDLGEFISIKDCYTRMNALCQCSYFLFGLTNGIAQGAIDASVSKN